MGDLANHYEFRKWLSNVFKNSLTFDWQNLEIREFYWREVKWDSNLIDYINSFDYFIIGGGNFLETWVTETYSGTSIGFSPAQLSEIKIPIFFNSLGVDVHQGISNKKGFEEFFETIISNDKNLVTLRNDGAMENLETLLPHAFFYDRIEKVPDAGFFAKFENNSLTENSNYICVNLACDMENKRFPREYGGIEKFCFSFSEFLIFLIRNFSYDIVFVPHIFSDLKIINQTISFIPDKYIRKKVSINALSFDQNSLVEFLNTYKNAQYSFSMRFHSNVCSIGNETRTIGLSTYPQVANFYKDIESTNYIDFSNNGNFKSEDLIMKFESYNDNISKVHWYMEELRSNFEQKIQNYFSQV